MHVVDIGRTTPVTRFWQSLEAVEASGRLRCCAGARAEAFLLWWPGGLPIAWTQDEGAACEERPGCIVLSDQLGLQWQQVSTCDHARLVGGLL